MTGFMTLEIRRALRDVRYLVLAVAMPIGLYLLFAGLFGSRGQTAQGLPQPTELMVAMVAYGALSGVTRSCRVQPMARSWAIRGPVAENTAHIAP